MLTPMIVGAAANDHRPTGSPPPVARVAPVLSNPDAQWLAALNVVIHSSPTGNLPGGCASALTYQICAPHVSVDGVSVSDVALVEDMLSVATHSSVGSQVPSLRQVAATVGSPLIEEQAVARAVADQLLYQQGQTITSGALGLATTMAHQQLAYYLADPAAGDASNLVPKGMTASQYFLSAQVIAGYEHIIVIGREETALAASNVNVDTWVGEQTRRHVILVNGAPPAFSIPEMFATPGE